MYHYVKSLGLNLLPFDAFVSVVCTWEVGYGMYGVRLGGPLTLCSDVTLAARLGRHQRGRGPGPMPAPRNYFRAWKRQNDQQSARGA
jgi:hypothetical protein